MNVLSNARLGTRLAISFGLVLLLLVSIAATGIWQLTQLEARLNDIANVNNVETANATAMRVAVNQVATGVRDLVLVTDEAENTRLEAAITQSRANYDAAEQRLSDSFASSPNTSQEESKLLERIKTQRQVARPITDEVIKLAVANKNDDAIQMILASQKPAFAAWLASLGELTELEEQMNAEVAKASEASYQRARTTLMALSVLAIVVGLGAAGLVTRSITRQLGGEPAYAQDVVREIAAGNLAVEVRVQAGDTSSLLVAMKGMRDSLAQIVGQVRQSSDSIATGSAQIATGNADLSQRTEEQASNLQQTAASMEQLTSTVKQNGETARTVSQLALAASAAASDGGAVVGRVVATMDDITASSKRIADIIGVIDGIAFQTNILALNAAVEAARAGEQGRGFAVVASEVRILAQRSADAAREIKTLIGQSVEKVEEGSRLVGDAGVSIDGIIAQVKQVADLIREISAATLEQTQGIGQVSDAVTQLDQVTQQNAALVEESAAAAESLRHQATQLTEVVGVFRLDSRQAVY
jgi:methyl-accepting chemotaxis protein